MGAFSAFRDGVRRVNRAPVVLAGMFTFTLLLALPLSLALRGMIAAHLGTSLMADRALSGANYEWWQELSSQATGLATTFVPSIIGFGAVLDNLSAILDNLPTATTIAGATAAWLVIWSFLSGGVLDRYARDRATRAHGFFAACGVTFWRFLRLGIVAWCVYCVLFVFVHGWIFRLALGWLTRDLDVERTAFLLQLAGYIVFGALLILANIVFDYARVRIVVEDRRSAIGALVAGTRFVARHPGATTALYVLNAVTFLVIVLAYAVIVPGAPGAGLGGWLVLLAGELYILGRHYAKLLCYASETALFQGTLAHAAYTAAPAAAWPESPAIETIVNSHPEASS